MTLALPHTAGCLVCGRDNPHGLRVSFAVDPTTGIVTASFTPSAHHIGFTGIVHGGVLATVLDEAMVWAASWQGRRFCVCGEMTIRFRQPALIDQPMTIQAKITTFRARLIQTSGVALDPQGAVIAESTGKYVPMPVEQHARVIETFVPDRESAEASALLSNADV